MDAIVFGVGAMIAGLLCTVVGWLLGQDHERKRIMGMK